MKNVVPSDFAIPNEHIIQYKTQRNGELIYSD